MKRLLIAPLLLLAVPAVGQNLPELSGRIVDQADLLPPDREAALLGKLEQLQRDTSRQLVVVTVPELQGYPIEEFGIRLGEQWKLGSKEADNGAILLIAPTEKQMRIEVGDGLEPILTDAMSWIIIRDSITPRFKTGDMAGGIEAGTDAIIAQLRAPPEAAEAKAIEAQRQQQQAGRRRSSDGGSFVPMIFWFMVIGFVLLSMVRGRGRRGRRGPWGARRYGGSDLPILLWALGSALDSRHRSSRGGSWGGGGWGGGGGFGGGGGGGFGGFSGGGGSFGGGGASGSW